MIRNSTGSSSSSSKLVIQVHPVQRGNPILKYFHLVEWRINDDIIPDYVMGSTCAIFLSLKYHLLAPKHAERRIAEVGKNFRLRTLIVLVDDTSNTMPLLELNRLCFIADFTLVLTWSNLECARYIETFRHYEDKPSTSIQVN